VPAAGRAAEPDIGSQSIDAPLGAATGMPPSQPNDVAEKQLEHRAVGHRRVRVSEAWCAVTRHEGSVGGRHDDPIDGFHVDLDVGKRRLQLGDDPAGPGQ